MHAVIGDSGGPLLAKRVLELVSRHVQVLGGHDGRLGGDGVVVLIDVLVGVDIGSGDLALLDDGDALRLKHLLDLSLECRRVGVRLGKDESGLLHHFCA